MTTHVVTLHRCERPSWTDYYLNLAYEISKRSIDPRKKHGCILTNPQNRPIGQGYNSLPAGFEHSAFPLDSPSKNKFIIHAEQNALDNRTVDVWSLPYVIAYVTGRPCPQCLCRLANNNVKYVIVSYGNSYSMMDDDYEDFKLVLEQSKILYCEVKYE